MTREERLTYCKVCENKAFDPQQGIICNLTGKVADFERSCSYFIKSAAREPELNTYVKASKRGFWFSFILFLILLNGLGLVLTGIAYGFANISGDFSPFPFWYCLALFIPATAYASGAVLMFMLKRIGIFIFIGGLLFYVGLQIIKGEFGSYQLYATLINSLICFMVIAPKWDNFE